MHELKELSVDELIKYENNSRTHSDDQLLQIVKSITEFGFTNPILVSGEKVIIAGHGRLSAAKMLDMQTVPCIILDHLSDTQIKAYVIADNQIPLNAGWDLDMLKLEIKELDSFDFNLNLLGFDDGFLDDLLEDEDEDEDDQEDDIPEANDESETVLGDVWILGEHRVMCGDSTSIDEVEKLMDGEKADMVFTDPPYNINFKPQRNTHDTIKNDNMSDVEFVEFLKAMFANCKIVLHPDTYLITFMGWSTIAEFKQSLTGLFAIKSMPIWEKNNFGIGYYTRPQYEPFFLCLNGDPIKPNNPPSDIFKYSKVHKTIHSCEKPVGLIKHICSFFNKNGLLFEPFGGSGSTLIACEKSNRRCYAMELDPKYCDVIIKRWEQLTGQNAIHAETGEPFQS